MTWSFRQLAAGAQTLRLFTALVCSVAVTSAVAGPMAWQALEYRRDEAALLAPAIDPSEASSTATQRVERGGTTTSGTGPGTTPTTAPGTAGVTSGANAPATDGRVASSTTVGSGALSNELIAPRGPVSAGTPPPNSVAVVAEDPIRPGPTPTTSPSTSSPSNSAPPTTAPVTTVSQPPTATTTDPLDEFNPRPPCDDAAHELRVDAVPDCEPTRP